MKKDKDKSNETILPAEMHDWLRKNPEKRKKDLQKMTEEIEQGLKENKKNRD